ncbi:integrase zinc binding domain-containing protein, partial [Staphylococcus aureus]
MTMKKRIARGSSTTKQTPTTHTIIKVALLLSVNFRYSANDFLDSALVFPVMNLSSIRLRSDRSLKSEVLEELHLEINKTITMVRERFYWPHLRDDVEE